MGLDPRGWLGRYLDGDTAERPEHVPAVERFRKELPAWINRKRVGNQGRGTAYYAWSDYHTGPALATVGLCYSDDAEPILAVHFTEGEPVRASGMDSHPERYVAADRDPALPAIEEIERTAYELLAADDGIAYEDSF